MSHKKRQDIKKNSKKSKNSNMTWMIHKWKSKDTGSEEPKTKINFKDNSKEWQSNKQESISMPENKKRESQSKKFYKP